MGVMDAAAICACEANVAALIALSEAADAEAAALISAASAPPCAISAAVCAASAAMRAFSAFAASAWIWVSSVLVTVVPGVTACQFVSALEVEVQLILERLPRRHHDGRPIDLGRL